MLRIYFLNYSFLFITIFVLSGLSYGQNPTNYPVEHLCNLDLNRTASKLTPTQLATVAPAIKGFVWNTGDNETDKFRPQGITDVTLGCKKFIAVSWYGRSSENYENRGARISFVDITDMNNIQYRHVLLVDENYNTFNNIHAGGLLVKDDTLYIPDTRSATKKRIYGFPLSNIQRVPTSDLANFYNYRYIIKRVVTKHLPIQASTISYDWDSDEMLIATFKNLCTSGCTFNPETTFSWFGINNVSGSSPYHENFFDRTQGMASIDNPLNPSRKLIWSSTSYGRYNPSHIYAAEYDRNPNNTQGQLVNTSTLNYTAYQLPPGLEDLHFEQDRNTLWTLTEFTPNEGVGNNRFVFAFNKNDLMPPGQIPDDYSVVDLCDLDLNRTASKLNAAQLADISPAQKGFIWNSSDNSTLKYSPQGITRIPLNCRDYIGVSWYGNQDEEYGNRGSRVSFVDINDMDNILYRHVLLVDEQYQTFENIEVGGLLYKDDTLYIPDTRQGSNKKLYGFALNNIQRVPDEGLANFFNYRYILKRVVTYDLPIQTSGLSYDWVSEEIVLSTFVQNGNPNEIFNENSSFSWSKMNELNNSIPYHSSFFNQVKGLATVNHPLVLDEKMMWASTSNDPTGNSILYATTYNRSPNNISGQVVDTTELNYSAYSFPPGLRDLHFESDEETLWTLTEYGSNEGVNNKRIVFSLRKTDIMPPENGLNIQGNYKLNNVLLFPNPTQDEFCIDIGEESQAQIYIYNGIGQLIKSMNVDQQKTVVNDLITPGYYLIEVHFSDRKILKKLLIK